MENWTYKPIYNPVLKGHVPAHRNTQGWIVYKSTNGNWRVINPERFTYSRNFRCSQSAKGWVNSIVRER